MLGSIRIIPFDNSTESNIFGGTTDDDDFENVQN